MALFYIFNILNVYMEHVGSHVVIILVQSQYIIILYCVNPKKSVCLEFKKKGGGHKVPPI